jgi:glycine/D-amino acid oxidase-like deaminating enzyme
VPDLEARGFKIAHDKHGPVTDPDRGDRTPTAAGIEEARAYLGRRFPGLAGRPLNEARVCQYENSSSGDYLIDRHPELSNVLFVGAGSGHGFKNGPAVGRAAAAMVVDPARPPEPRFTLASKARVQNRAVH